MHTDNLNSILPDGGGNLPFLSGMKHQKERLKGQFGDLFEPAGPWVHALQREIHEQPVVLAHLLDRAAMAENFLPFHLGFNGEAALGATRSVTIVASGSSYHAGLIARYWIESLSGLPCAVELASEYRYRDAAVTPDTLVVALSPSGENADTLAALQYAESLGQRNSLGICNVPGSSLMQAARLHFLTGAGTENGLVSTKTFTAQLVALYLLGAWLGKAAGRITAAGEVSLLQDLRRLLPMIGKVLRRDSQIRAWAKRLAKAERVLLLGRGAHTAVALEGALKLKTLGHLHAEAYAAGEFRQGSLALLTPGTPVIAIAPRDALYEKLRVDLQEVRALGGDLYVLADRYARIPEDDHLRLIRMPDHVGMLSPVLHAVPLQMLAYHVALERGLPVDRPRQAFAAGTCE